MLLLEVRVPQSIILLKIIIIIEGMSGAHFHVFSETRCKDMDWILSALLCRYLSSSKKMPISLWHHEYSYT